MLRSKWATYQVPREVEEMISVYKIQSKDGMTVKDSQFKKDLHQYVKIRVEVGPLIYRGLHLPYQTFRRRAKRKWNLLRKQT